MIEKLGRTKKVIKVGKISDEDNKLTVGKKQVAHIKKMKKSLETNPLQIELYTRWLKAAKMRIKKIIEKRKNNCQILVENMFKVLLYRA